MMIKKYKKSHIIAFFILGLPFFAEFYLNISYREFHSEFFVSSLARTIIRLIELSAVFLTTYIAYLLSNHKKMILLIWALLIYIPTSLNIISVYVSGFLIHEDFLSVIFNTDIKEATNCLKDYSVYIFWNFFVISSIFFIKSTKITYRNKYYGTYAIFLLISELVVMDLLPFHTVITTMSEYYSDMKEAKEYDKKHEPLNNIQNELKDQQQTYVIVIGESVDRKHMSIYGYNRQTTPYFDNLKSELSVFKNVNTAHAFTSGAVKSMFQLNTSSNTNNKRYTLIHFFKDAGFKTFWFSNQGRAKVFDSVVTHLGKLCDEYKFINDSDVSETSLFDEFLLKYFRKALQDKAKQKLIVLHLMGSHIPLKFRYPKEFRKFKISNNYYDKRKATYVTYYDNSILYTDYILNKIINLLKFQNGYSAMLYLSDHGQDINDTKECELGTRTWPNSYEVPFIIWISDEYKNKNSAFIKSWNTYIPYVTDKTAYTIIDLARMKHQSIDLSKSILSRKKF